MLKRILLVLSLLFASIIEPLLGSTAFATDLSVANLEVTQSMQYMDNATNADNSLTLVRVEGQLYG